MNFLFDLESRRGGKEQCFFIFNEHATTKFFIESYERYEGVMHYVALSQYATIHPGVRQFFGAVAIHLEGKGLSRKNNTFYFFRFYFCSNLTESTIHAIYLYRD